MARSYHKAMRASGTRYIPDGASVHYSVRQIQRLTEGMLGAISNGKESVTTTEIYATVSLKRKRELLEAAATAPKTRDYPDWSEERDLMSWLKSLC